MCHQICGHRLESKALIREKKKDSQYYHQSLPTKTQEPTVTTESPSTYSNETYQKIQDRDIDKIASDNQIKFKKITNKYNK
jgi:hypothetical protein